MHVIVLGGADNQLACIAAARRLGADVTVVDPRSDVPGIALADAWLGLDVMDTSAIASRVGDVDAVLTDQSDYAVRAAALLSRALGLPGQDPDLAETCTNKLTMRQRVARYAPDLVPWFEHFTDPAETRAFVDECTVPVVVKPLQSQGSRGVSLIPPEKTDDAVSRAFDESPGLGILVEEAVSGREYSVDGFVRDGRLTPLGIAAKTHYAGNPCLDERCDFLPSQFIAVEQDLRAAMDRVVAALGIRVGIVHAELLAEPGRAILVEIALRGGGGGISSTIVPFLSQFDPVEELLRELLGLPGQAPPRDFHEAAATLRFLPPGPVPHPLEEPDASIVGWESLVLSSTDSSTLVAPRSSADRMGAIIVTGPTEEDVAAAEMAAMERLGYPPAV
jgi:biotin carboxylase